MTAGHGGPTGPAGGATAPLAPEQRSALRAWRRVYALGALGAGLCLLLLALLGALGLRGGIAPTAVLVGLALGALWLWMLAPTIALWRRAGRDLREGRVAAVDGPAIVEAHATPGLVRLARHRLHIGGRSFALERAQVPRVIPGALYRALYAPRSGVLLDLLPLERIADRREPAGGGAALLPPEPATTQLGPVAEPPWQGPAVALTEQERELLRLIAAGLSNKEIAARMALSVNTVKMYCSQLYRKLGASRRTEAVARARRDGLL